MSLCPRVMNVVDILGALKFVCLGVFMDFLFDSKILCAEKKSLKSIFTQ